MPNPPVSIVMSVFNGESYLSEAIESILGQTFPDFEFIIIDDGSTDRTPEILADYAAREKRIRILHQQNRGRVESLNTGIGVASGKYIARMDADDIALPLRIEKQFSFMERNHEVGLLGGAFELMNARGEMLRTVSPPVEDADIKTTLAVYNPICHPTVLMRKDVGLAAGLYRKALLDADDYDLWLRIGERSKLANLAESILRYRIHPGQTSVRGMRQQITCVLAARAAASLRSRGLPEPLSDITEITPQLLASLGVTDREFQECFAGASQYWMGLFGQSEPEATLAVAEEALRVCSSEIVGRGFIASAWLLAARIQYRQGRTLKALHCSAQFIKVQAKGAGQRLKSLFSGYPRGRDVKS